MKTEQSITFQMYLSKYFRTYLSAELGVSTNTIRSYAYTFKALLEYLCKEKHIRVEQIKLIHINRQYVNEFLDYLQDKQQVCDRTRNIRLAAISSFARFMQFEDVQHLEQWQNILRIKKKKEPKPTIPHLSVEGIKTLLSVIPTDTRRGRRDLALLALMYDSAGRVQEIADLTPCNIRIAKPYHVILHGKGNKSRIVPIQDEQFALLEHYMQENRLNEGQNNQRPLFFNSMGNKLSTAGIAFILQKYIHDAHELAPDIIPEHLSPHSLRHSKAMHLLQAGVSLIYIRDLLGHTSIKTTEIYARADSKQKREAIEQAYVNVIPTMTMDAPNLWEENKQLIDWLDSLGR